MKKTILIRSVITGLCLLSLTACSESPIGSLKSSSLSTTYDRDYWVQQQAKNTPIWQQAWDLCNHNPAYVDKPNCESVGYAHLVGESKWPGYGHDGGNFTPKNMFSSPAK